MLTGWTHWMPVYRGKKNCPYPVVRIFFMSVTYSTNTDIKTVVKCWHDIHMISMFFRSIFAENCVFVVVETGRSLDEACLMHPVWTV